MGAYLNIDPVILFAGASGAQSISEERVTEDDPRDVKWWLYGYALYFEEWYKGGA